MVTVPGMELSNRVSATAQYNAHIKQYGDSSVLNAMRVTFTAEFNQGGDLEAYLGELSDTIALFNGRVAIALENSYLLHVLEPKNGYTMQTYKDFIKTQVDEFAAKHKAIGYYQIGQEVPTATKDGIKVFVTKQEPLLEYTAAIVLEALPRANLVRATSDMGLTATAKWAEQASLL